jgi:hypothetical protein
LAWEWKKCGVVLSEMYWFLLWEFLECVVCVLQGIHPLQPEAVFSK